MREMSCGDRWQRRRGRGILTLVAATALLVGAGVQLLGIETAGATTTSFTWTGGATSTSTPSTASHWSLGTNWSGTVAPISNATGLQLTFPTLGSSCNASPPSTTCYASTNNLNTLGVTSFTFGARPASTTSTYSVNGNQVTLGSGGLSVSTDAVALGLPVVLGATQTWTVSAATGKHDFFELAVKPWSACHAAFLTTG